MFLLLRGEDVGAQLGDVLTPQRCQLLQPLRQLAAPPLQQLAQTPVVTLDLVLLQLVAPGATLQPLTFVLRMQQQLSDCRTRPRTALQEVTSELTADDRLTAPDLLVSSDNRLLQLLELHLTRHDLPFLEERTMVVVHIRANEMIW